MVSFARTIRSLAAAGLLAAGLGLASPASAAPGAVVTSPAETGFVPARQEFPWWLIPDRRDRERWDDRWDDDDRRDRRRHRARERCLDRDRISYWGHWDWDHGRCRWVNGRPER
jgi:hypothetical protein